MSADEENSNPAMEEGEYSEDEEGEEVEEEEEEEEEEAEEVSAEEANTWEVTSGKYNASSVNDQIFEELVLHESVVEEVKGSWQVFLSSAESRDVAGEAIYAALFDSAPSLQSLFKTPRAVMAMRFMNGLNQIISQLNDPKALKVVVETLGFQHLDLEVTVPRVEIFREAIVDLLVVELGGQFSPKARDGWATMLNYAGGSYIYVRTKFAVRIRILASSWATANNKRADLEALEEGVAAEGEEGEEKEGSGGTMEEKALEAQQARKDSGKKQKKGWFGSYNARGDIADIENAGGATGTSGNDSSFKNTSVPTSYNEMFMFNAAVMGFAGSTWMNEVLSSFDTIVTNVSNSYRLQEECDVLSLRIAKYKGTISLPEYKAVMLASLRSLVPKDWNSDHEVAWGWLWENVERMLAKLMGKPQLWERSLDKLYASLDENTRGFMRREIYSKFFTLAPAGQDYFKQSTTRLHFIADRVVDMTLDMFKDPKKKVEDISALGLRHVGYGIPTDLFGPFVTACVQVIRAVTEDNVAEEAFRWSLSLVSRVLVRVITEGSTIVMKAINSNNAKQLKRAVSVAPRGKRALWVLNIQVGTQSISPVLWAIETGSLEAATAIIDDLLTIRADRDRYYYGMDTMFERHADIIFRLTMEAPDLLPTLLDGLIWRARTTENGMRRVNYYIKHLVQDEAGGFSKATEWLTENGDPKLVCHPVVAMVTDMIWTKIAFRTFLLSKSWVLFTLLMFIAGTSFVKHLHEGVNNQQENYAAFATRAFIYTFSMGQWVYHHVSHIFKDIRARSYTYSLGFPIPEYLTNYQDQASFLLTIMLILMLACEPILHCLSHYEGDFEGAGLFTKECPEATNYKFKYSLFAGIAVLCYFVLIIDISVFFTRVSAFVLICSRVLSEVALFLSGLLFVTLAVSCALSALDHHDADFAGIHKASVGLIEIALGMYPNSHFEWLYEEPALLIGVALYVVFSLVFLTNLLIAQLNCAYLSTYQDMVGYARLNRGKVVVESMVWVKHDRWDRFLSSLHLDERIEFGEGDIGLAGGVQVLEPASANITTIDMIRRFGGSTSPAAQWPSDDLDNNDEDDKFERLEKLIEKAMKRMSSSSAKGKGGSASGGSTTMSGDGRASGSASSHSMDD